MVSWLKKSLKKIKIKYNFFFCIKTTRVGPILLGSAEYRKQGYYFVWPNRKTKHKPYLYFHCKFIHQYNWFHYLMICIILVLIFGEWVNICQWLHDSPFKMLQVKEYLYYIVCNCM